MLRPLTTALACAALALLSFPVSAQLLVEAQQIEGGDTVPESAFGAAGALQGNAALVGAPGDHNIAGAAYVFVRDPQTGQWTETQKLSAADAGPRYLLGTAVGLFGDVALVGAPAIGNADEAGAAYVFVRDPQTGQWAQAQKLTPNDSSARDRFGVEVAVYGDVAVIASELAAVYFFVRDPQSGQWTQVQSIRGTGFDSGFGSSISVVDDLVMIGAPGETGGGAAYVYIFDELAQRWVEWQRITGSDTIGTDSFGEASRLTDGVAVIGAPRDYLGGGTLAGSAYVFEEDPQTGEWVEAQKLTPSDPVHNGYFGTTVDVAGNTILVGAFRDGDAMTGPVYVFERDGQTGTWAEAQKVLHPAAASGTGFGSLALEGPVALLGVPRENLEEGRAYTFEHVDAVAVTATADTSVPQGGTFTLSVTVHNPNAGPIAGRLVLDAVGPGDPIGPHIVRALGAGALQAGATVSRTYELRIGDAPAGTWAAEVRVEDGAGQTLGIDAFTVEVTPARPAAGVPFGAPFRTVEEVVQASAEAAGPASVVLAGPNPFRERTALAVTLGEAGAARLTLHDVLGREVAVVAEGPFAADRHVVPVEAGALPGGVYVWRLVSGSHRATGRLTIVR